MIVFKNDSGELVVDQDVLFTKQVATFKNFTIKGDVSVSFTVQNNSYNRSILGYYGFNQIESPILSGVLFSMIRNGVEITRGTLVIEQDTGEELSLFFISGNANWFDLFSFSCKQIRNTSLQMQANFRSREISWGITTNNNTSFAIEGPPRDYGIVFPWIDTSFKNKRFSFEQSFLSPFTVDPDNPFSPSGSRGDGGQLIPCLYVHTLLNELSKVAGVKIDGDILEDKFFRTLVITPESIELFDEETGEKIDIVDGSSSQTEGDVIKIEMVAPKNDAVDIIKWICISFGCIPIYNVYSSTLTLNQSAKIKPEEADNWTDYVRSYVINNDVKQHNYINMPDVSDEKIEDYNETNQVTFGSLDIEADKTDGSSTDVYTSIFGPSWDDVNPTGEEIFSTYIPFCQLTDAEPYQYTSVTSSVGKVRFNGTGFPFSSTTANFVFRIEDDNGIYDGFHFTESGATPSATVLPSASDFISDSSGTIWVQNISYSTPGPRILSIIPRINFSQFTNKTSIETSPGVNFTCAMIAYFHKPFTIYSLLNGQKQGLSYGEIEGRPDITLSEKYLRVVSDAVKNPTLKVNCLLPYSVYKNFDFSKFVYLNTGKLNGYFMVESIANYKDSLTLVEVTLYKIWKKRQ